jgi:hypothetical protein
LCKAAIHCKACVGDSIISYHTSSLGKYLNHWEKILSFVIFNDDTKMLWLFLIRAANNVVMIYVLGMLLTLWNIFKSDMMLVYEL